ncbi:hypothetical protein GCM10027422_23920 [Hymenobacter arcticus]
MPPEAYLHSDVQEIMVAKPSLALQWGNVVVTGLALLLLTFTAWFQYPEFITTEVSLAAQSPVDSLVAPAGNRGAQLLVPNGASVRRGTPLLAWQDADHTDYHEAQRLKQALATMASSSLSAKELAHLLAPIREEHLGQLRPIYQGLLATSARGAMPGAQQLASSRQLLASWEQRTVALAPQDGIAQVSYPAWSAGAPVPTGRAAVCLLPQQAAYVALGTISREQYATVRQGQRVLVQVRELGDNLLTGKVLEVSPLAHQQHHQVVIALTPPARQRLYPAFSGSARILLRQQSLLAKFLAR